MDRSPPFAAFSDACPERGLSCQSALGETVLKGDAHEPIQSLATPFGVPGEVGFQIRDCYRDDGVFSIPGTRNTMMCRANMEPSGI